MGKKYKEPQLPELEVKPSQLPEANRGLFTKTFIPKGSTIVEYTGRISTWAECNQMEGNNSYLYYLKDDYVIDASDDESSMGRYANDAQGLTRVKGVTNNAKFKEDGFHVFIVATKDIQPGSEIFVGYGKEYWDVIRDNIKIDLINGNFR